MTKQLKIKYQDAQNDGQLNPLYLAKKERRKKKDNKNKNNNNNNRIYSNFLPTHRKYPYIYMVMCNLYKSI